MYLELEGDREEGACGLTYVGGEVEGLQYGGCLQEELRGLFYPEFENGILSVFLKLGVVGKSSCLDQIDHYYYAYLRIHQHSIQYSRMRPLQNIQPIHSS